MRILPLLTPDAVLLTTVLLPLLGACASAGAPRPRAEPEEHGTARSSTAAAAPAYTDTALLRQLTEATRGFGGDVGIYVRHLPSGASAEINADEIFPTASIIKVPLLVALYDRIERGEMKLDDELVFRDSLRYADSDPTAKLRDGEKMPLSELAFLMISFSDNTAALWIQALVGGGAAVNQWLGAHGFEKTRVNSRTPGREEDRKMYGWGQMTPREISELMLMIRQGRAVSPAASEWMYRTLTKIYYHSEAMSQIPPTVQVASKQGTVDQSRSETLVVNAPTGDYLLTVVTKNQQDTRRTLENAGYGLIRNISRIVYQHFNPADPWRPAPLPERFRTPPDTT